MIAERDGFDSVGVASLPELPPLPLGHLFPLADAAGRERRVPAAAQRARAKIPPERLLTLLDKAFPAGLPAGSPYPEPSANDASAESAALRLHAALDKDGRKEGEAKDHKNDLLPRAMQALNSQYIVLYICEETVGAPTSIRKLAEIIKGLLAGFPRAEIDDAELRFFLGFLDAVPRIGRDADDEEDDSWDGGAHSYDSAGSASSNCLADAGGGAARRHRHIPAAHGRVSD
jgi:hypothetical protein